MIGKAVLLALAIGMAGAPAGAAQSITVAGQTFPIHFHDMRFANCESAFATLDRSEVAATRLAYGFAASGPANGLSKVEVSIDHGRSYVDVPVISWPSMSDFERQGLAKLNAAFINHETGHLRIAVRSVQEVMNEERPIDLADFDDEIEQIKTRLIAEQDDYDADSEHGIRQSRMPAPFTGPDTMMRCR